MLDRFSPRARAVVAMAEEEARRFEHHHIGTEHLILGLLVEGESPAAQAIEAAGATLDAARSKVDEAVRMRRPAATGQLAFSTRAARALERASRSSLQRRDPHVGTGHIVLGVLGVEGTAGQVLRGLGVDTSRLRAALEDVDPLDDDGASPPQAPAGARPTDVAHDPRAGGSPAPAPRVGPRCAGCRASLQTLLAHQVIRSTGERGRRRDVVVAYCGACGAAVGAFPA